MKLSKSQFSFRDINESGINDFAGTLVSYRSQGGHRRMSSQFSETIEEDMAVINAVRNTDKPSQDTLDNLYRMVKAQGRVENRHWSLRSTGDMGY